MVFCYINITFSNFFMIEPIKMVLKHFGIALLTVAIGIAITSCKSSPRNEDNPSQPAADTLSTLVKFDNAIFPTPSPWQVIKLIQK